MDNLNFLLRPQNLRKEEKMNSIKLNNTPVRTSKSFNINNIEIDESVIPDKIEKFTNVSISDLGLKTSITSDVNIVNPKFGMGDLFINQINNLNKEK